MEKIRNLNDLAKHFNCTAMTVSMALRDSSQLPVSLREKIKQFARENNFFAAELQPAEERPPDGKRETLFASRTVADSAQRPVPGAESGP
ncbi:MAG: LacI family DNA-binding transcriptional regulator [Lentisphaeria bacterium]|nr:MAG: LacI family DNA-binding transcriptional regulator [Lentisphaeria bacterium]